MKANPAVYLLAAVKSIAELEKTANNIYKRTITLCDEDLMQIF